MLRQIPINEKILSEATEEDITAVTALFVEHRFMDVGDSFVSSAEASDDLSAISSGEFKPFGFPGNVLGDAGKGFCQTAVDIGAAALAASTCTISAVGSPAAVALCLAGVEAGRIAARDRC
jgi:hypothetical protein